MDNVAPPETIVKVEPVNVAPVSVPASVPAPAPAPDAAAPEETPDYDSYLKQFEEISTVNTNMRALLQTIPSQPDQDSRFKVLLEWATASQAQNERMYSLLVSMDDLISGTAD